MSPPADLDCQVTVRADASPRLGYGHVRRTLTVVEALQKMGVGQIQYLMTPESDNTLIETSGHKTYRLKNGDFTKIPNIVSPNHGPLILDTYTLEHQNLNALNHAGYNTVVFDDGNRLPHYKADIVIDYSPAAPNLPYRGLDTTRFCLGPSFFPLRSEFAQHSFTRSAPRPTQKILITFGGSDPEDLTARILHILAQHSPSWQITAVLGPGYSGKAEAVAKTCPEIVLKHNVSNMAPLFLNTDLAISGAGGTALELASLGVSMLLFVLSNDQESIAKALQHKHAAINSGRPETMSNAEIWHRIYQVASDEVLLHQLRSKGPELIDGTGAERIARLILQTWRKRRMSFLS